MGFNGFIKNINNIYLNRSWSKTLNFVFAWTNLQLLVQVNNWPFNAIPKYFQFLKFIKFLYDENYYSKIFTNNKIINLTVYPIPFIFNKSNNINKKIDISKDYVNLLCFSRIDYIKNPLGVLEIYEVRELHKGRLLYDRIRW